MEIFIDIFQTPISIFKQISKPEIYTFFFNVGNAKSRPRDDQEFLKLRYLKNLFPNFNENLHAGTVFDALSLFYRPRVDESSLAPSHVIYLQLRRLLFFFQTSIIKIDPNRRFLGLELGSLR